jgi:hypothetical protein
MYFRIWRVAAHAPVRAFSAACKIDTVISRQELPRTRRTLVTFYPSADLEAHRAPHIAARSANPPSETVPRKQPKLGRDLATRIAPVGLLGEPGYDPVQRNFITKLALIHVTALVTRAPDLVTLRGDGFDSEPLAPVAGAGVILFLQTGRVCVYLARHLGGNIQHKKIQL